MEPISPELVLVDPELARAARAALRSEGSASLPPPRLATPTPPASGGARGRRSVSRVVRILLVVLVGGGALSVSVGHHRSVQRGVGAGAPAGDVTGPRSVRPAGSAGPASSARGAARARSSRATGGDVRTTDDGAPPGGWGRSLPVPPAQHLARPPGTADRGGGFAATAKMRAELFVLSALPGAPKEKVPRSLLDPSTGLARTNDQAICHAGSRPGSFLCLVRRRRGRRADRVLVGYSLGSDGEAHLSWYGRRKG